MQTLAHDRKEPSCRMQQFVELCVSLASVVASLFLGLGSGFGYASVILLALSTLLFVLLTIRLFLPGSFIGKTKYGFLFLLIVIVGFGYSTVFTPLTVPDEDYHFAASYEWSNVLMGKAPNEFDGSHARTLLDDRYTYKFSADSLAATSENFEWIDSSRDSTDTTVEELFKQQAGRFFRGRAGVSLVSNPLQVKLPSALGLVFGRLLGLGFIPLYFLGRVFNLLAFAAVVVLAVKITPKGKPIFAVLSLLPMTLHEAGSYSYDAMTIAYAFLATAMFLSATEKHDKMTLKEGVGLFLVTVILAPCKVIYFLVCFLVLLIPGERFSSRRNRVLFCAGIIFAAFATVYVLKFTSIASISSGSSVVEYTESSDGTLSDYEVVKTISVQWALSHPVEIASLVFRSLKFYMGGYISQFVGVSLGWRQEDIIAPLWTMIPLWGCLLLSTVNSADHEYEVAKWHRLAFAIIFFAGCSAVVASMLFGNTAEGAELIRGVQGRYFLPFAPLAFLAIHPNRLKLKFQTTVSLPIFMACGSLAFLCLIVSMVV